MTAGRAFEFAGLVATAILVGGIAVAEDALALLCLAWLPVDWAAIRWGRRGLLVALAALAGVGMVVAYHGSGPFTNLRLALPERFTYLALYLLVVAAVTLFHRRLRATVPVPSPSNTPLPLSSAPVEIDARFRAIFEQAAVGIAEIDSTSGKILHVNPRYCDLLGYLPSELHDLDFMQITHPDDLAADLAAMAQLRAGAIADFKLRKRLLAKNGTVVWVDLFVAPVTRTHQARTRHVAAIVDVTAQYAAETALRDAASRLALLTEAAQLGIWAYHPQDKSRVEFDARMREMWHLPPTGELTYRDILAGIEPLDRAFLDTTVAAALRGENDGYFSLEYRLIGAPDDAQRWIAGSGRVQQTSSTPHIIGVCQDITDRKSQQASAQESLERLDAFLSSSNVVGWIKDPNGKYLFMSQTFRKRYAIGANNASQLQDVDAYAQSEIDKFLASDRRVLMENRPFEYLEELIDKSGKSTWWLKHKFPLTDAGGNRSVGGFAFDATEHIRLRNTRDELRILSRGLQAAQEEERKRIARDIHDDLRGSLTAVKLQLDLHYAAWTDLLPLQQKPLQMLGAIVGDLLVHTDAIIARLRPPALDHLGLRAALEQLANDTAAGQNLGCRSLLPVYFPTLGEEYQVALYRIAQEGFTNIAKHAGARKAELRLAFDEENVTMEISDDGCGYSSTPATGRFGLLGVRERAELLGGTMAIVPSALGGTTLRVSLPTPRALRDGPGADQGRADELGLAAQSAIHRCLEIDKARVGTKVLEGQDLGAPHAAHTVVPINPEIGIGQPGPG